MGTQYHYMYPQYPGAELWSKIDCQYGHSTFWLTRLVKFLWTLLPPTNGLLQSPMVWGTKTETFPFKKIHIFFVFFDQVFSSSWVHPSSDSKQVVNIAGDRVWLMMFWQTSAIFSPMSWLVFFCPWYCSCSCSEDSATGCSRQCLPPWQRLPCLTLHSLYFFLIGTPRDDHENYSCFPTFSHGKLVEILNELWDVMLLLYTFIQ